MRQLVEVYALRAREYSDEVARLGEHQPFGEAFTGAMAQVHRRRALSEKALTELERHLNQESVSSVGTIPLVTRSV